MIAWILHIPILLALAWTISRKYSKYNSWVPLSIVVKVLGTLAFGFIFIFYYGQGDSLALHQQILEFKSYQDGGLFPYLQRLFEYINPHQGNPRTVFIVRMVAPLSWLSFGNYWITGFYLSLFFIAGCWRLIEHISQRFPASTLPTIIAFCFLPSLVFWNAGLSKDTIANGSFFFLCSYLLDILAGKFKRNQIFIFLLLFLILVMSKHYLAGTFFFLGLAIWLDQQLRNAAIWKRIVGFSSIIITALIGIRFFFIRLRPERLPLTIYELNQQILEKSEANTISFNLEPNWLSLISQLPKALWSGLFLPLPWKASNVLQLMVSIENLIFLILSAISIWLLKRVRTNNLLMITVIFIALLSIVLSLTTPNLGSLSRYKTAFLPFFFIVISTLPLNYWRRRSV